MPLGIGLGSFVNGISGGMNLRDRVDTNNEKRSNKAALSQIDTDAKGEFDKQLGDGVMRPDQWDDFYQNYALPKKSMELLRQGDVKGASDLRAWADTAEAKKGGQLFASALFKAQTGDPGGALQDAIKAGQEKGYIDHGYSFEGQDTLQDKDGNVLGYRLTLKDGKGKTTTQDVMSGDVGRVVSTFLNPDAAWQSQVDARSAQAKTDQDLTTYEGKKRIDAAYDRGNGAGGKLRSDAISALRKRMDGGLAGDEPTFDDLPDADKEAAISKEITLQTGAPTDGGAGAGAAPTGTPRKVMVDSNTGTAIGLGDQPATAPAPVAAPPAAPQAAPALPAPQPFGMEGPGPAPAAAPQAAPAPVAANGAPVPANPSPQQISARAGQMISQGADPQQIAKMLAGAGIPPSMWPSQLTGGAPIGLGG